jgi:hypothetical protein
MYKVPLDVLEGLLNSLEKSNAVLNKLAERDDSLAIQGAIRENDKQIKNLKLRYSFLNDNKR